VRRLVFARRIVPKRDVAVLFKITLAAWQQVFTTRTDGLLEPLRKSVVSGKIKVIAA
jgi:hypothetical protein